MPILVLTAPDFAPAAALEARWLQDLPRARRDDLAGWPDRRARHRSLIGSRLLGQGLRRLGHQGDCLASLRYALHARPTLDLAVDFSLSHCDGRVLCAVSTAGPVGVDVERLGELCAADFPLYLNPGERAWAGADARRFYSIWTRKEAVAKAAGTRGMADLARVDTRADGQDAEFAGQAWQTVELSVGGAFLAHLACRAMSPVTVEHVSRRALENPLEELVN